MRRIASLLLVIASGTIACDDGRSAAPRLESASFRAAIDVSGAPLSPEIPLGTTLTFEAANDEQTQVALASNREGLTLAVWADDRFAGWPGIYATYIAPDGGVLVPGGIAVSREGYGTQPAVASDGEDFVLVWVDGSNGVLQIDSAQLSADPSAPLRTPIQAAVVSTGANQAHPALAFAPQADGGGYLLAWEELDAGSIGFARLGLDGTFAQTPLFIAADAGLRHPSAAWSAVDGRFAIAYEQDLPSGSILGGALFDEALNDAGALVVPSDLDAGNPSVAAAPGGGFVLAWENDGQVLLASASDDAGAPASYSGSEPALASSDAGYALTWQDANGIEMVRSTGARTNLGGPDPRPQSPAIAAAGGSFRVAWDQDGSNRDAYWNSPGGTAALLSQQASVETGAAVSSSEQGFLAAAMRGSTVFGRLLDASGCPGATLNLANGAWGNRIALASDGSAYLLAYVGDYSGSPSLVRTAIIFPDGGNQNGGQVSCTDNSCDNLAAAAAGSGYGVVWVDDSNPQSSNLMLARADSAGRLGQPAAIASLSSDSGLQFGQPALAGNGSGELFASWIEETSGNSANLRGVLIGGQGPGDGGPFDIASVDAIVDPAAASDGTGFRVLYRDTNGDLVSAIVAPDGGVEAGVSGPDMFGSDTRFFNVGLAYDGTRYIASGEQQDSEGTVSSNLGVSSLEPGAQPVLIDAGYRFNYQRPVEIAANASTAVLAYARFDFTPDIGSQRAYLLVLGGGSCGLDGGSSGTSGSSGSSGSASGSSGGSGGSTGGNDLYGCSSGASPGALALLALCGLFAWRRRGPSSLLVLLLALAVARPARADGAHLAKSKVAVLTLQSGPGIDPKLAELVTRQLTAAIEARTGLSVISSQDIQAALGLERSRQLLGCTESTCMAELGGALGVDLLVSGELARVGSSVVFDAQLMNVARAVVVQRYSHRARDTGDEGFLDQVEPAATALFPQAAPSPAASSTGPATAQVAAAAPEAQGRFLAEVLVQSELTAAGGQLVAELGYQFNSRFALLAGGTLTAQKNAGALVEARLVPFNAEGRLRPFLGLGVPILFHDAATVGIQPAVGLELLPTPWLTFNLEVPFVYYFNGGSNRPWYLLGGLGVGVRI